MDGKHHAKIKSAIVLILCIIIVVRFIYRQKDDSFFSSFTPNSSIHIVGRVESEPDVRDDSVRFTFSTINEGRHSLLAKTNGHDVVYGDQLDIVGILKKPGIIIGDDGREFDYGAYLSKDSIFYTLDVKSLHTIKRNTGNYLIARLYEFKHAFINKLNALLPSPQSFLAGGLIITGKGSLSKELQLEFQKVGLIHIVVLSGFNVTIVGEAVMRLLSFLPTLVSSLCGAVSIVLFSIMTGGGSTVTRAMIMSLIGLFARVTNRTNSAVTSLLVAAALMLVINPVLLIYDPSFQMSFAATLGLILLSEPFEILLRRLCGRRKVPPSIISLIAASCATQAWTFPLILSFSGIVSIVALPMNAAVLPFVPLTMLAAFLAGAVGFISTYLATPFTFVSWALLSYELAVVHFGASLPFAALFLKPIGKVEMLLLFIGVVVCTIYIRRHTLQLASLDDVTRLKKENITPV